MEKSGNKISAFHSQAQGREGSLAAPPTRGKNSQMFYTTTWLDLTEERQVAQVEGGIVGLHLPI